MILWHRNLKRGSPATALQQADGDGEIGRDSDHQGRSLANLRGLESGNHSYFLFTECAVSFRLGACDEDRSTRANLIQEDPHPALTLQSCTDNDHRCDGQDLSAIVLSLEAADIQTHVTKTNKLIVLD